jgi:hypothetical protein
MLLAMRSPLLTACVAVVATAACDPQATTDYAGEPMAQVRGVMSSRVTDVPDGLVPFISWEGLGGPAVDVVVRFPSSFTIDLYQPPHDEALSDLPAMSDRPGEVRLGFGSIELWPALIEEEQRYPLGVAERHMLLYADGDMAEGTLGAAYIGAVLTAGYHVVKVIPAEHPSCPGEHDCLRYSSLDLDTSIEVRIDWAENLDRPDLGPWLAPAPEGSR